MSQEQIKINECWKNIGVWSTAEKRCPELDKVIHCRNCPVYSAAGRKLLDRSISQEYQQECSTLLAKGDKDRDNNNLSGFVFRAGGEWLALSASLIQEVLPLSPIHSLPHRSSHILRGLASIRGKLEICFSIGGVLGIERDEERGPRDRINSERLVVASVKGQKIVFPVSEVMGIIRYSPKSVRSLPVTVSGSKAVYTKEILCLDDLDIGILEDKLLFEALTRSLI